MVRRKQKIIFGTDTFTHPSWVNLFVTGLSASSEDAQHLGDSTQVTSKPARRMLSCFRARRITAARPLIPRPIISRSDGAAVRPRCRFFLGMKGSLGAKSSSQVSRRQILFGNASSLFVDEDSSETDLEVFYLHFANRGGWRCTLEPFTAVEITCLRHTFVSFIARDGWLSL